MCRGQKGTPAAAATMGTRAPALRASGSITSSGCFALIRSPLPWGQPPDWGTGLWVAAPRERQRGWRARQGGTARTALMRPPGGSEGSWPCSCPHLCGDFPSLSPSHRLEGPAVPGGQWHRCAASPASTGPCALQHGAGLTPVPSWQCGKATVVGPAATSPNLLCEQHSLPQLYSVAASLLPTDTTAPPQCTHLCLWWLFSPLHSLVPVRNGNSRDMTEAEPMGTPVCSPKNSARLPRPSSSSTHHGAAQLLHNSQEGVDGCTSFVLTQPRMHTWPCLYSTVGQDFPSSSVHSSSHSWVSPQPHSGQLWAAPGSTGQKLHQPLDSIPSCSHGDAEHSGALRPPFSSSSSSSSTTGQRRAGAWDGVGNPTAWAEQRELPGRPLLLIGANCCVCSRWLGRCHC